VTSWRSQMTGCTSLAVTPDGPNAVSGRTYTWPRPERRSGYLCGGKDARHTLILLAIIFAFIVGFAFFLVWWAHEAERDRSAMVGLYLLLGAPGFLLTVAGLAVSTRRGIDGIGPTLLLGGLGLCLPLFPPVLKALARIGNFRPDDPVHLLGSGVFWGAIGFLGGQLVAAPEPAEVTTFEVGPIIVQGFFFIALALVDRDWAAVRNRLALVRPTPGGLAATAGAVFLAFISSGIFSALTRATNQEYADEIDRSLEVMTTSNPSYLAAPLIGLSAGIGEELLFRGALQPRYGIVLTSILFALLHAQYGLSFITFGTFTLGCIFGILAMRHGTTHAIIGHTLYNTLAVIIANSVD
jgi:membrane protease YdiL (CAAX protease family)